jgi:hypothetical protein
MIVAAVINREVSMSVQQYAERLLHCYQGFWAAHAVTLQQRGWGFSGMLSVWWGVAGVG